MVSSQPFVALVTEVRCFVTNPFTLLDVPFTLLWYSGTFVTVDILPQRLEVTPVKASSHILCLRKVERSNWLNVINLKRRKEKIKNMSKLNVSKKSFKKKMSRPLTTKFTCQ